MGWIRLCRWESNPSAKKRHNKHRTNGNSDFGYVSWKFTAPQASQEEEEQIGEAVAERASSRKLIFVDYLEQMK
jgi:hypothetical protein